MSKIHQNRKKPLGGSGILAALLISPRAFAYTVCDGCERKLFYTYTDEQCPHCGSPVTRFVAGHIPAPASGRGGVARNHHASQERRHYR